MLPLTEKMQELLLRANLNDGTIDRVALSTLDGLVKRGLVAATATGGLPGGIGSKSSGRFPEYSAIKLTEAGIEAASLLRR